MSGRSGKERAHALELIALGRNRFWEIRDCGHLVANGAKSLLAVDAFLFPALAVVVPYENHVSCTSRVQKMSSP